MRKLYNRPKTQGKRKRGPFANYVEAAMEDVYPYLENSDGECQFSLDELIDQIKGDLMQHGNTREFYKVSGNLIVLYFKEISNNFFKSLTFFQS